MYAIVKDGQIVKTGRSIRALFPSSSIPNKPSTQWLQNNGVQEVVEGLRKDERFYWVTPGELTVIDGQATQSYVNTEKLLNDRNEVDENGDPVYVKVYDPTANDGTGGMVDTDVQLVTKGLKSQYIAQEKEKANKQLESTDWYIIRKYERNIDIPEDVVTKRSTILSNCDDKITAINNATTVEELITALQN